MVRSSFWNQPNAGRLAKQPAVPRGVVRGVVMVKETVVVSSTKPISPAFAFGQAVASGDNVPSEGAPSIVPELPVSKGYLLPDGDVLRFEDPTRPRGQS